MRIFRILPILFSIIFLWVLLLSPQKTFAVTLTPLLSHDGLTIEQPLTLSSANPADDITMSLSFGKQQEVAVTTPTEPEVLVEAIVVPTVSIDPVAIEEPKEQPILSPTKKQKMSTNLTPTPSPTTTSKAPLISLTPLTPTAMPQPTASTTSQLLSGGLNADKLFAMTNTYRQSKGLSLVQKDDRACQVAISRAPEIAAEIAEGRMHSGIRARNLPYWNSEIIITMRTEEEAFNWWINDTIHREAIEGNYTYSCAACHGNACVQEFTNFQSK